MGNLRKLLKEVITPERFREYQEREDTFIAFVGYVDETSGKRVYVNLKSVPYHEAIESIMASSSIPVFTKPVNVYGDVAVDGGVRDHIGTPWILDTYKITRTISIYSRPEKLDSFLDPSWKPKNVFDILMRTMDILMLEVSKTDERIEDEICKRKKIKQKKIFLPKIMQGFYDIDPFRLKMLYKEGKLRAKMEMLKPW